MSSNMQNKFMQRLFKKVDGVVWDLSSSKLGLQNKDGIYTFDETPAVAASEGVAATDVTFGITVNPFDNFGFAIPAFAQNTKIEDIEIGDLIVGDNKALGWVTRKTDKSLFLLDQNGMAKNYTPPKVAVMGQDGAMVVKSLTGLLGAEGASGLQGSLLPMMMLMGGEDGPGSFDMEKLLPILLFTGQQSGGNPGAISSAMPTILMMQMLKSGSGTGGASGMKEMMLMQMMMGGGMGGNAGGMNPMMLAMMSGGDVFSGGTTQNIAGIPALTPSRSGIPPLTPAARRY